MAQTSSSFNHYLPDSRVKALSRKLNDSSLNDSLLRQRHLKSDLGSEWDPRLQQTHAHKFQVFSSSNSMQKSRLSGCASPAPHRQDTHTFENSIDASHSSNLVASKPPVSLDSLKDLFNPQENTLNLAKLSVALKLERSPLRNAESSFRTTQSLEEAETLQGILSLTLQKLKRRPGKALGKLKPITGQPLA